MISVIAALSIRDPLPCVCPPQAAASGSMLLSVSKMLGEGMAMAEKMLEKAAGELSLAELEGKVRLRFRLLRNPHARCAPSTICSNEFDSWCIFFYGRTPWQPSFRCSGDFMHADQRSTILRARTIQLFRVEGSRAIAHGGRR